VGRATDQPGFDLLDFEAPARLPAPSRHPADLSAGGSGIFAGWRVAVTLAGARAACESVGAVTAEQPITSGAGVPSMSSAASVLTIFAAATPQNTLSMAGARSKAPMSHGGAVARS
jgi:hypothetical protein